MSILRTLGFGAPTIFDIGANTGKISEAYYRANPECIIHCFEPNPILSEKIFSRLGSRVLIVNEAVGAKDGVLNLRIYNDDTTSSILEVEPKLREISSNFHLETTIPVSVTTLDSYCAKVDINQVDLLKIDTQGFDLEVLNGARSMLASDSPPSLIQIEMTISSTYVSQPEFHEVWTLLSAYGYRLFDFDRIVHTPHGNIYWGDALFISSKAWSELDLI